MPFPDSLIKYLHSKLVKSLSEIISDKTHELIADEILNQIARLSGDDTRNYHSICEIVASGILRNEIDIKIGEILKDVGRYYSNLIDRKEKNKTAFKEITKHHRDILYCDSLSISSSEVYSESALVMGNKMWVKSGNEWMISYADKYFYGNGAEISYYKLQKQFGMHKRGKDFTKLVKKSRHQYTLIDVGSCYNPFDGSEKFRIIALDLYPAPSSDVYHCNFLDLIVGSSSSELIKVPPELVTDVSGSSDVKNIPLSKYKLIQLPSEIGDVCCLSLVLSFLPTPTMRYDMVQKARLLLKTPVNSNYDQDYDDLTMKGGLLLIVEKESIMSTSKKQKHDGVNLLDYWQKVIESIGFILIYYKLLVVDSEGRKSHTFAFRTTKTYSVLCSPYECKLYIKKELSEHKTCDIE